VALGQTEPVRNVLPDLLSNTVEAVKLACIVFVVALSEPLYEAPQARSATYTPTPIGAAAVLYFLLLWPAVRLRNRAIAGRG